MSLKKNTNIFKKYFNSFVIVFSAGNDAGVFINYYSFSFVVKLYFYPITALADYS